MCNARAWAAVALAGSSWIQFHREYMGRSGQQEPRKWKEELDCGASQLLNWGLPLLKFVLLGLFGGECVIRIATKKIVTNNQNAGMNRKNQL